MKKNKNLRIAAAPRRVVIALALLALVLVLSALFLFLPARTRKNPRDTHGGAPDDSQKNPQPAYVVVTEMTDAGRALPAPSIANPVYYLPHWMGKNNASDTSGGAKEPWPWLQKALADALAANGWRPADVEHAPTQVLFLVWGTHNKIELPESPVDAANIKDLLSRAKAIGGQKFADAYAQALKQNDLTRLAARDEADDALLHEVRDECHFLIVTSLDVEALKQNQKKILWTTRISTVPHDASVDATALSTGIIDHAAQFFGRETPPKSLR